MKKKIVSVLLCVAMVATMAVGCGGKKTDGDSGSSKGGDKLVYWAMWSEDEPQAKVIKDAIAKYTEDTGVKVDVQFKAVTDSVKDFSQHWTQSRTLTYLTKMLTV